MSAKDTTTIKVGLPTWRELNAKKQQPGETFNDVLTRLIQDE